jgi:hypothetical protein
LDKHSARISQMFNQVWLSRYPRPNKVISNNGYPQSNAVVERIHQVSIDTSMIKTQQLEDQVLDYVNPFGKVLASIAWAIQSSYHRMLEVTPAQC